MGKGSRRGGGNPSPAVNTGSGAGSVHTPVEAKETSRSKQLIKIVEVISEGEVAGLADEMKSVYLDNTPVQNKDGSYNFKNVSLQGRIGGQVQDVLSGFSESEREVSVSAQVRRNLPITRTITDSKVSRLRITIGVQALSKIEDNGDINGSQVKLLITVGSKSYPVTISGKYSSQYLQQHTFGDLPPVPFTIKVERLTEDSGSQKLQNNTLWSSYTEVIDTEFTYPNTALIGVKFDSEYFSNLPTRTYDIMGIKVKIPSNYNPITRQYSGVWDGTFKIDWTDNPAWVLFDIVTNKRYGLGNRLGEFGADKWTLYQVAQYCDQLVPDGFGGKEPRFTCNAWLTEQRSAYDVINDVCSIFRAMPVWNGQQLTVVMDRPADPVWTYTNANVEGGEFNYTFSAKKARHNAIQVEYVDKNNSYERMIEYVSDDESIRKNGLNVKKITAFGCTSRGQAHRTGLWLLQTEKLETKTVTFTVGAEGLMHIPGDIIKVADTYYAGTNIGGRVLAINGKKVTLDREIAVNGNSYFSYINQNARHQDIKIISAKGAEVTLDQAPTGLEAYGVWSLSTQQVTSQLFKALSVKEEEKGKYTITALQHEPQKEAIVDNGAKFEPRATSILSVPQISNINVNVNQDGSVGFSADITGGQGLVKYDIKIYKDGALYDVRLGQSSPNINLDNFENGEYTVVIRIKNEKGQLLSEKAQTFVIDKPPAPTGVIVTGGLGNITIEWDWINDATATEIFVSEKNDIKTAKLLTKVNSRVYTHEVGANQVRYYWLRHTRGVNIGPFYQLTGIRGESSVDIDAELEILNKKLSKNIVNEVIDTALPARNLDLIKTVSGLNTNKYQGYNQVYNTIDGKLYVWNGREYTTKVQASDLSGKVNKSQLDNALIGEITSAKSTADTANSVAQQAKSETASISVKINNAESAIKEIKSTKANKDEVVSLAKSSLQATWKNDAKAEVQSISRAVADINGKLSATHTIKTQAISGGKTAIAGISLGANREESSVIVMADKFQVVPNVNGAPKPIFKIQNGKAVVAGDLIADGEVTASKLAANSVTTGALQAGAVRAEHMAAGQITAEKMAIGLGGNLLYNPIFDNNAYGWSENRGNGNLDSQTTSLIRRTSSRFNGLVTNGSVLIAEVRANSAVSSWWQVATQVIRVVPNQRYCLSAFIDAWNCTGELMVQELSSDGASWVRDFAFSGRRSRNISGYSQTGVIEEGSGSIEPSTRTHVFFTAPSSGYVSVVCIMRDIKRASVLKIANPMLEECTKYATQPSPWQNAGVTAIHGGSIVTNSITAQQMAANSITANEIATGAVAAKHIATGSIGADHIATRSLTSDKLNVNSLSAISSNIGRITAGTITGTNINGNNISGGTITGASINGGELNINDRFKVDRYGHAEMRASNGDVGLVINNDNIIVYDYNGNVRVRIGRL